LKHLLDPAYFYKIIEARAPWVTFCREGPPHHDLLVCILPNDNAAPPYERLRATTRR
jgi:hypothetical protein